MKNQILCPKCNSNKIRKLTCGFSFDYRQVIFACKCVKCQERFAVEPHTKNILSKPNEREEK